MNHEKRLEAEHSQFMRAIKSTADMTEAFDKALCSTGLKVKRQTGLSNTVWSGDVEGIECVAVFHAITNGGYSSVPTGKVSCSLGVGYEFPIRRQAYTTTFKKGFDYNKLVKSLLDKRAQAERIKAERDAQQSKENEKDLLAKRLGRELDVSEMGKTLSAKVLVGRSGTGDGLSVVFDGLDEKTARSVLVSVRKGFGLE